MIPYNKALYKTKEAEKNSVAVHYPNQGIIMKSRRRPAF